MSQVMSYRGSPLTPPRGLWVLAVSFPSPAQALNLCMICEKNFHYDFPWLCGFFHISVHLSGPRLAAPRWGKASHRLEWVWPWTWGKNSPENCLVDLGPDTRTSTQSRRLVRRKGTHAHELGATAITDWLGIAFSTDWLSTDDLGQNVGERAQK